MTHQARLSCSNRLGNRAALIAAFFLRRPCSILAGVVLKHLAEIAQIDRHAAIWARHEMLASLSAGLPMRFPRYLPGGALTRRWVNFNG
jgi:hypothetical protein